MCHQDANKDASSNGAPPAEVPGGDGQLALSKDVIDKLRATVFTFDSFFVTSVENYDANGVLFKGNLRGKATESQKKLKARLQVWRATSQRLSIDSMEGAFADGGKGGQP